MRMYNTLNYAQLDKEFQLQLLKKYKNALRQLEVGGLSSTIINGNVYYRKTVNKANGGLRTYLGNDDNLKVRELKTSHFLQESIKRIEINLKAFEHLEKHYKSCDPNIIEEDMKRAYKIQPSDCFAIAGITKYKGWGSEPYENGNMFTENLKHMTIKGEMVRSKSELNIANAYFFKNIEYRYEEVLHLGDRIIVPDFTILSPINNEKVYHEHAGMTFDDSYMLKFNEKLKLYRENGIVPWKNLIITYDDENGNLDLQHISRMLNIWFEKQK